MLIHTLSDDEKTKLIRLIRLILILDSSLLWDGKTEEELTGDTNISNISINISNIKEKNFKDILELCNFSPSYYLYDFWNDDVDNIFIRKIKHLRLTLQNSSDERLKIALEIMRENILEKNTPSRVILFEMMKFSLENNKLSESRKKLLKEFSQCHNIEDEYFNDLLKQSQILQKEIQKTIYLILE